ncbi:PH domain-containing protein [Haladaptatus salinisoli]|uniref:PH domain-containing protein n=1 Tax=Haladaptatus salinisoli TaxID=2884876 RepID=UPI001D0B727B|nr:PH domain-containing protein [Haladaptatus salinisoli]
MSENFEPSWLHLTPDEEILWAGHRSVYYVLPAVTVGSLLILIGAGVTGSGILGGLGWIALLLVPIGFAVAVPPFLRWRSEWYVLTTEEVYHKTGVFGQDVTQVRLDRIQNTTYSQSLVERVFNYGDVTIHTAGTGSVNLVFENIADPQRVNGLLTDQLDRVSPRRQF